MRKPKIPTLMLVSLLATVVLTGCVERRLTITTRPTDALVVLNDEEIGRSPVTVPFSWYGDYNVRISKDGFETLKTHRELKGPWYDKFPWDFFAQVVNSKRIVDSYEWTFDLPPRQQPDREDLIRTARELKDQLE